MSDRKDEEIEALHKQFLMASSDAVMEQDRANAAEAALDRVRALHYPTKDSSGDIICHECSASFPDAGVEVCEFYPCPTILAAEGDTK